MAGGVPCSDGRRFGDFAVLALFQPVYPLRDVAEHFGRYGFLYLPVLIHKACGTVLEEVVQARVFLDEILFRLRLLARMMVRIVCFI